MTEQNPNTPIADNNSETNDSTKAEQNTSKEVKNENNHIPQARLDEVVAQRNTLRNEMNEIKQKLETDHKKELERQGEYKTLLEEQKAELDKYKADSTAWNDYKTNKRVSIMERITNDEEIKIAKKLPLSELELFANRVTQTNTVGTPNQRPANSTKGTGEFGGYSSYVEWAEKDPEGYQKANNSVRSGDIKIGY